MTAVSVSRVTSGEATVRRAGFPPDTAATPANSQVSRTSHGVLERVPTV